MTEPVMPSTTDRTPSGKQPFFVRFEGLGTLAASACFPCDASGRVDMDHLSEAERRAYLFARIVSHVELASPQLVLSTRPT
jgi:hypothetical protein